MLLGTVANDSGSVLLVIGTIYLAAAPGIYWATQGENRIPCGPPGYHRRVRVAIVTPYSWTYPGGVNGHVDALARELIARGHELRVLAPATRPTASAGRFTVATRRTSRCPITWWPRADEGVRRQRLDLEHRLFPDGVTKMRRELRAFDPTWSTSTSLRRPAHLGRLHLPGAPVVGTFHAYSTKPLLNASPRSPGHVASSTTSPAGSPSRRPPP